MSVAGQHISSVLDKYLLNNLKMNMSLMTFLYSSNSGKPELKEWNP